MKAILYDLDGVLVNACEWHYLALNIALSEICGFEINRDDHLNKFNGLSTRTKLKMLVESGDIDQADSTSIFDKKQDITRDIIESRACYLQDKIELHNSTRARDIISVCVTNAIRETATLMLHKTGQFDYIDFIISNEDVSRQKPDPNPYLIAISRISVDPSDMVMIEDSDTGYQSAFDAASITGANVIRVQGCDDVNLKLINSL